MYRTEASVTGDDTVHTQIIHREQDPNLNNEFNLSNQNALTMTCLNGHCAFSKVQPRSWYDVSEQFEPTALTHRI